MNSNVEETQVGTENVEQTAPPVQDKPLTPQEIKEHKAKRREWYKSQVNELEPEKKYFSILADIEEAKARGAEAQVRQVRAYIQLNPPNAPAGGADQSDAKEPVNEPATTAEATA